MKGSLGNPSSVLEKMNHMPRVILAGLLDRFSETAKGSSKYVKQVQRPADKLIMSELTGQLLRPQWRTSYLHGSSR